MHAILRLFPFLHTFNSPGIRQLKIEAFQIMLPEGLSHFENKEFNAES